jgi:hypothetical protein
MNWKDSLPLREENIYGQCHKMDKYDKRGKMRKNKEEERKKENVNERVR